jgi:putative transposase
VAYLSCSYEDVNLQTKTQEELMDQTVGLDRGVIIPVQSSTGESFDFSPEQKRTMEKKQQGIKRWQRRLSRQQLTSNRRKKVKQKISKAHEKQAKYEA